MLSNKNFFLILITVIVLGILYTGYNYIDTMKMKNSEEYLSQIQSLEQKIRKERRKINYLKRHFQKNPDITTMEYYMALVKQFKYLVRGSYEIESFSLNFLKTGKRRRNKNKKKINLLSSYLKPYKGNKYIKSLELITTFKLSNNKTIDPNKNTINFFKLYKPLIYLYYLKKNKPIIIRTINYSRNTYNIYMQILGN